MITKNDIKLGKKIKKYRKENGLTQQELAEKIDMSTKYIQFIETGKRKPSLKTIYKIVKALKIKIWELFKF